MFSFQVANTKLAAIHRNSKIETYIDVHIFWENLVSRGGGWWWFRIRWHRRRRKCGARLERKNVPPFVIHSVFPPLHPTSLPSYSGTLIFIEWEVANGRLGTNFLPRFCSAALTQPLPPSTRGSHTLHLSPAAVISFQSVFANAPPMLQYFGVCVFSPLPFIVFHFLTPFFTPFVVPPRCTYLHGFIMAARLQSPGNIISTTSVVSMCWMHCLRVYCNVFRWFPAFHLRLLQSHGHRLRSKNRFNSMPFWETYAFASSVMSACKLKWLEPLQSWKW